ncbi:XdhC family protein [Actinomadura livida]|uniref:Xanthine dehydrogenase accessory factor n=1 Tax=Actinomadura livida TaxID=79909 RepID=A0A7W7IHF8_9ACTN|nr:MULTISPECIES: XdhC family protein [Actinomadura]MBB4777159.1 xanthine dehydrogenase accessory factor [Actinomadura catellatispora]GGU21262.1 carbon monoxide dehydrogenase F protein [Actinomadura livida]
MSDRTETLRSQRTPYVLATVVRAERPTSAKTGDRALVLPDGTMEGFVGGECAESAVRDQALRLLASGESTLLRITPGADSSPLDGMVTVTNPCLSGGTLDVFLETVIPPALVTVHGDGPVARALVDVGRAAGFDARPAGAAEPPRPDAAAVVVATHGRDEEALLTAALRAGVPYVGLIASRKRGAAVTASLEDGDRVRTPAGLDIGARTAPEIALSVLAEILARRPAPEHAPAPTPAPREADQPEGGGHCCG